jgi:DNA-binding MarR family transcriptional regulator
VTKLEETRACLNFVVRRTSRIVGRYYDAALKPTCLKATQFNVMSVLAQSGPASFSQLAALLGMERSVLARNLKPLERQGFVTVSTGGEKRVRVAELTKLGKDTLRSALAVWSNAHAHLSNELGARDAAHLIDLLRRLAERIEGRE